MSKSESHSAFVPANEEDICKEKQKEALLQLKGAEFASKTADVARAVRSLKDHSLSENERQRIVDLAKTRMVEAALRGYGAISLKLEGFERDSINKGHALDLTSSDPTLVRAFFDAGFKIVRHEKEYDAECINCEHPWFVWQVWNYCYHDMPFPHDRHGYYLAVTK